MAFMANGKSNIQAGEWILDFGATNHLCKDPSLFIEIRPYNTTIITANGTSLLSKVITAFKIGPTTLHLTDTLYCRDLVENKSLSYKTNAACH